MRIHLGTVDHSGLAVRDLPASAGGGASSSKERRIQRGGYRWELSVLAKR
jgi:hypothetical protein